MAESQYKFRCPNCGDRLNIRNSEGLHPLMRAIYLRCQNMVCGASYRAQLELTHIISPSGWPNPAIDLPMADSGMRAQALKDANDNQLDMIGYQSTEEQDKAQHDGL